MKISFKIIQVLSITVLIIAGLNIPQHLLAQRFNHSTFSNREGAPYSSNTPPIVNHPQQSNNNNHPPVVNHPQNNQPPVVNHPQQYNGGNNQPHFENHPPVDNHYGHENINGGGYNIGHHDFNQHENVVVRENRFDRRYEHENHSIYHYGNYRGIHPYSYHPFHPYSFGPRWHPVGFFLGSLAYNAFRFTIGNQWYYYDNGCYYVPSQRGYTVIAPPVGAVVNYLPEGYETTMVGNDYFYYFAGAFYVGSGQRFQVVQAPYGAVISQLPVGAVEQDIDGQTLMIYNNTYFEPIYQDGREVYEVVPVN